MLTNSYTIIRYGEIALKGKNRRFFEEKLVANIKEKLSRQLPESFEFIRRISGRILIKTKGSIPNSKLYIWYSQLFFRLRIQPGY